MLISLKGATIETHPGVFYANSSVLVEVEFVPVCFFLLTFVNVLFNFIGWVVSPFFLFIFFFSGSN